MNSIEDHLQTTPWTHEASETLWEMLQETYQEDAEAYKETIMPLLVSNQAKLSQHTLCIFYDFDELEDAIQMAPIPCFGLEIPFDPVDEDAVEDLAQNALLRFIIHLELQGEEDEEPGAQGVRTLLSSPYLQNLITLNLIRFEMGNEGVQLICQSEKCQTLRTLNLSENDIDDDGLLYMKDAPFLPNLQSLKLWSNAIKAKGIDALAGASSLRELTLDSSRIGPEGARALGAISKTLRSLDLEFCHLSDTGLIELAQNDFSNLDDLNLDSNHIGDEGIIALAQNQSLKPRSIKLNHNNIGDAGLAALASSTLLHEIEDLEIYNNQIGDEGVRAFAQAKRYSELGGLSIQSNPFGDEGMVAIVDHHANFPELGFIVLADTKITEVSMKHLAQSPFFAQLDAFYIDEENDIDPSGWEALIESPYAPEHTVETLKEYYEG